MIHRRWFLLLVRRAPGVDTQVRTMLTAYFEALNAGDFEKASTV